MRIAAGPPFPPHPWWGEGWGLGERLQPRTRSLVPDGERQFQIDFDFVDYRLVASVSDGTSRSIPLVPMSVAELYGRLLDLLAELGISARIHESRTVPR